MALGTQLGENELPVDTDLEGALIRGDEGQRFDQVLELLEQIVRQAHGPAGVVSDGAVDDLNFEHAAPSLAVIFQCKKIITCRSPSLAHTPQPRYNPQSSGRYHADLYVSMSKLRGAPRAPTVI